MIGLRGCVFFFFKQKTAYEMRISDWSSDVCSSDLRELRGKAGGVGEAAGTITFPVRDINEQVRVDLPVHRQIVGERIEIGLNGLLAWIERHTPNIRGRQEIGRASCRERVCQYV